MPDDALNDKVLYTEGSNTLRNYSTLTMQVRAVSMYTVIGSALMLGAALLRSDQQFASLGWVLSAGGVAMIVCAASLNVVNWHYATAFIEIRDMLAQLEWGKGFAHGPWNAHKRARGSLHDVVAHILPFLLMTVLGLAGVLTGWPLVQSAAYSCKACASGVWLTRMLVYSCLVIDLGLIVHWAYRGLKNRQPKRAVTEEPSS